MQGSPTFLTGPTGLELLATETQSEALSAIGAEKAIQVITNANGTAWRFEDGLQICIGFNSTSVAVSSAWGAIFASGVTTLTFPAAFDAAPRVAPAPAQGDGNVAWQVPVMITATTAQFFGAAGTSGTIRYGYIAIGTYTP